MVSSSSTRELNIERGKEADEMERLTAEWPWNPNHKIKFFAIGADPKTRWLFRISFANKDQSLYLTPLFDRDFALRSMTSDLVEEQHCKQDQQFHLSIHESGVVI